MLPNRFTTPQHMAEPLPSRPLPPTATATSQWTMTAYSAATTRKTTPWATSSTQTTTTTTETATYAPDSQQRWSTALQTDLLDDEHERLSKNVVDATFGPSLPQCPQRRSRRRSMPSGWPQLAPRPCVTHPEPSPSTVSSQVMKRVPPDLPHSERRTTTQERSSTPLDPTTTFQLVSQPPVACPEPPQPTAMSQSTPPVYLAPQLPELQRMPSNLPQLAPAPLISEPEPPPSTTSCLIVPNPHPPTTSHPKRSNALFHMFWNDELWSQTSGIRSLMQPHLVSRRFPASLCYPEIEQLHHRKSLKY
jgi:hypothetical protein